MRNRSTARLAHRSAPGLQDAADADADTSLHEERLDAVMDYLVGSAAATVLDLGCGSGALLQRLIVHAQFTRIVGVDSSFEALVLAERVRASAGEGDGDRVTLRHSSFAAADADMIGFDAAALVETIEHIPPAHLSKVERAVFATMRPRLVVITTPNRDFNETFGMSDDERRHLDHRFEWGRARFESWCAGVADRNGYEVEFACVGPADAYLGGPTQLAVFRIADG